MQFRLSYRMFSTKMSPSLNYIIWRLILALLVTIILVAQHATAANGLFRTQRRAVMPNKGSDFARAERIQTRHTLAANIIAPKKDSPLWDVGQGYVRVRKTNFYNYDHKGQKLHTSIVCSTHRQNDMLLKVKNGRMESFLTRLARDSAQMSKR